jgi:hypothetical protein
MWQPENIKRSDCGNTAPQVGPVRNVRKEPYGGVEIGPAERFGATLDDFALDWSGCFLDCPGTFEPWAKKELSHCFESCVDICITDAPKQRQYVIIAQLFESLFHVGEVHLLAGPVG